MGGVLQAGLAHSYCSACCWAQDQDESARHPPGPAPPPSLHRWLHGVLHAAIRPRLRPSCASRLSRTFHGLPDAVRDHRVEIVGCCRLCQRRRTESGKCLSITPRFALELHPAFSFSGPRPRRPAGSQHIDKRASRFVSAVGSSNTPLIGFNILFGGKHATLTLCHDTTPTDQTTMITQERQHTLI